jgi:glycine cleavage system H protein
LPKLEKFEMIEKDLKYAETHEWARVDGDVATVGLSDVAFELLGDIVYVELPGTGQSVTKGQPFGVIESVKAASDMYAPISGEVVETNKEVEENFDIFKTQAYSDGWMIKIKMSDPTEIDTLLDADKYKEIAEKE